MTSKKTVFNEQWLDSKYNPQFVGWLSKGPNINQAYCKMCKKMFDLSNMGRQAVTSHAKGKFHQNIIKARETEISVKNYFSVSTMSKTDSDDMRTESKGESAEKLQQQDSIDVVSESGTSCVGTKQSLKLDSQRMSSFCSKDDVARAEVIWALQIVNTKMSFNSCTDIAEIFRVMFSDSAVASSFHMGPTKCKYIINHGLAPYFENLLKDRLSENIDYVVCFDESLNKVIQMGQMDVFVRFYDINRNRVCTEYYNSVFLRKATAQDLLDSFVTGLASLPINNILQVSMDGPNVNLSFLRKLDEKMKVDDPDGKRLMNLGVCGLHVIHGAIKTGLEYAKWDLHIFLRDIYYIFNDSPARRAHFIALTGNNVFPLKHCTTRWLESVPSIDRALLIFDDVQKFINSQKSSQTRPVKNVAEQMKDLFMKCKLAFFKSISLVCVPFLRKYQSSDPLGPFLFSDLAIILRNLMERFVKSSKMPNTVNKLLVLDLDDKENLREVKHVDIGFQTRKILREVVSTEAEIFNFKQECQKILIKITEKILERSPLKYKAVQGLSSLDPSIIFHQQDEGKVRFKMLLEAFYTNNRITDSVAEKAKMQYALFCNEAKSTFHENFKVFLDVLSSTERLDDFFSSMLMGNQLYSELWQVIKMSLLFSHGNATVESGFSVNKDLLVENLKEQSLIAQRRVDNAIRSFGSIKKIPITQKMLMHVRSARRRYEEYLEVAKKTQKQEEKRKVEKRKLTLEIKQLVEKRKIVKQKALREEEEIQTKILMLKKSN